MNRYTGEGGKFRKGNPGRPKGTGKSQFKPHVPEALEAILNVMRHGRSEKNRLIASMYLLDQALGRPTQGVQINVDEVVAELISIITSIPVLSEHGDAIAEAIYSHLPKH